MVTPEAGSDPADLILHGGTVLTMVDEAPRAEAVAVTRGRITAVGDADDVLALRGPDTRVVDLGGGALLPGFVDPHSHFLNAMQVVGWANLQAPPAGPITSIGDLVDTLQEHVARHRPPPGEWVVGYGYERSALAEGRDLCVDDLDPHFPDRPLLLLHSSNHGAVLNSAGFAAVGYDADTPTPPGGVIVRRPGTTEPYGLVMETAFIPLLDEVSQPSVDEQLASVTAAQRIYTSVGVTTIQEGATNAAGLRLLQRAADEGRLDVDLVLLPLVFELGATFGVEGADPHSLDLRPDMAAAFGRYEGRCKLQGVKVLLDGSPQGRTAWWTEPLLTGGPGGEEDWRGGPLFPPDVLREQLRVVHEAGLQLFVHVNGDAAIDALLDGVEALGITADDDARTVAIHSQCMRPDQLPRYAELGVTPSFFTAHTFYWGDEHVQNLGPGRAAFLSPMRSALDLGLRCSNHTDFSVTPMDPLHTVWTAVARQTRSGRVLGPDERIGVWEALRAVTIDAAWQLYEEADKGTIEVGKLGDLVVLEADPTAVPVDDIPGIGVVETFKEGVTVHRAGASD